MKIIKNKILPFKGFSALTLFGIIWTRKNPEELSKTLINHESIHVKQEKELLFVGFWILYILEWLFNSLIKFSFYKGYRNISFEKEAYQNEEDLTYLSKRKIFSWINYFN